MEGQGDKGPSRKEEETGEGEGAKLISAKEERFSGVGWLTERRARRKGGRGSALSLLSYDTKKAQKVEKIKKQTLERE